MSAQDKAAKQRAHLYTHTKKTEPPTFHPIDRYKLVFVAIISPQNIEMFLFCVSYRSREEDRISKPGGMSTPVKIFDDGVLSQASDQASSINDKQLPPLPGKETACCQMAVFKKNFFKILFIPEIKYI